MSNNTIRLNLSDSAQSQLQSLSMPLKVELELYFSCLIRLRVLFPEHSQPGFIPINSHHDKLEVYFHPIMTKRCTIEQIRGHDPDTETFPIKKPEKFIPKWLALDYRQQQWTGEFGY